MDNEEPTTTPEKTDAELTEQHRTRFNLQAFGIDNDGAVIDRTKYPKCESKALTQEAYSTIVEALSKWKREDELRTPQEKEDYLAFKRGRIDEWKLVSSQFYKWNEAYELAEDNDESEDGEGTQDATRRFRLLRKEKTKSTKKESPSSPRLVIPMLDVFDVIKNVHDERLDHLGMERTYNEISKVYYSITQSMVNIYVKNCHRCVQKPRHHARLLTTTTKRSTNGTPKKSKATIATTTNTTSDMTEKEKMLASELYNAFDPQLLKERSRAKRLCFEYNTTSPDDKPKRDSILKQLLPNTKGDAWIESPFQVDYGVHLRVGRGLYCNHGVVVLDCNSITIGDNCLMGPNVCISAATHPLEAERRAAGEEFTKPIVIGDNVWLGANCTVCPGEREIIDCRVYTDCSSSVLKLDVFMWIHLYSSCVQQRCHPWEWSCRRSRGSCYKIVSR